MAVVCRITVLGTFPCMQYARVGVALVKLTLCIMRLMWAYGPIQEERVAEVLLQQNHPHILIVVLAPIHHRPDERKLSSLKKSLSWPNVRNDVQ